ncbi:STAS domain-containing protein [Streptomyces alboniger]|uniref:STAS domain-containing protein n=1 Tax=Streptomyces alboniger TaxID=132473 RepID=A0A5J6HT38_STRAD|nr:STAS domain-containing protein [Streptomyces alboniger]QEV21583.1 hypothetical protein CP975_32225 [Streptomyces alboniger]
MTFLDCSTLSLLCRARRRALERDGQLALVCIRPWHLRILTAVDLNTLFKPCATVQEALNSVRRALGTPHSRAERRTDSRRGDSDS